MYFADVRLHSYGVISIGDICVARLATLSPCKIKLLRLWPSRVLLPNFCSIGELKRAKLTNDLALLGHSGGGSWDHCCIVGSVIYMRPSQQCRAPSVPPHTCLVHFFLVWDEFPCSAKMAVRSTLSVLVSRSMQLINVYWLINDHPLHLPSAQFHASWRWYGNVNHTHTHTRTQFS